MNARSLTPVPRTPVARVVWATDFSEGAAQAATRLVSLPLAEQAQITLLHVIPESHLMWLPTQVEQSAHAQTDLVARQLNQVLTTVGRRDVVVSPAVSIGAPHHEVVRKASLLGADLIVMGRHGNRPVRDLLFGSTAERIVRCSPTPMLIVAKRAGHPYFRPLVAVDLESESSRIIATALRLISASCPHVKLLHSYHVPYGPFVNPDVEESERIEHRQQLREKAEQRLRELMKLHRIPSVRWRRSVVQTEPRQAILRESVLIRADLIAIGTHGRAGLLQSLLGGVSSNVIQAATCDVLVVPTFQTESASQSPPS